MNNIISLDNLSKSFGRKTVLNQLNLSIKKGESLVIIGGSGTGKSVTLKCILGLIKPDHGKILINGKDTKLISKSDYNNELNKFGMLFQGAALFDSLKVWQNVAFGLIHGSKKITKKEAKQIAVDKLTQVGLGPEVSNLYPDELSGGMQKRVALARCIATNPEIILFDEPTTGLDPIMADVINDLIIKCVKELGATALSITHDIASARKIADRVAMLHDGKIIWIGNSIEMDNCDNKYVRQFINGSSEGPIKMNISN